MTQLEIDQALTAAASADTREAEARFAASLPDIPAREAMLHETSLEYRRLHALRTLGSDEQPLDGTLLARFLTYAPKVPLQAADAAPSYRDVFGHAIPYPWRTELASLCHAGPAPGSGSGG